MTVAVSRAKGAGRRGGDLRLDRQHGRQRRRLRGAGRDARRGDRPRGQDRDRQARPGADARRAGDRAAGQLRRRARDRPRARAASTRSSWSTRSTRTGSRARRRPPSRSATSSASRPTRSRSRSATPATSPPGGGASSEYEAAPVLYGFQAEGAAPLVLGQPVAEPETVASAIRIGNPARWEEAMDAVTASRGRIAAVSDEQILDAYRLLASREGVFCEPASAASVAGLLAHGLPAPEGGEPPAIGRLRAHRPRPQGPRHRARQGARGDRLRGRPRRGRARRLRLGAPRRHPNGDGRVALDRTSATRPSVACRVPAAHCRAPLGRADALRREIRSGLRATRAEAEAR